MPPPSGDVDKNIYTCLALTQLKTERKGNYNLSMIKRFGDKIFVNSIRSLPNQSGVGFSDSDVYLFSNDGGLSWLKLLYPPKDRNGWDRFFFSSDSIYNLRSQNLDKLSATDTNQWVTFPYLLSNNSIQFLDTYDTSFLLATNLSVYRYDTNIQSLIKIFDFNLAGNISAIDFTDSLNGWIISNQKIYNTVNGGQTWNLKYTFAANTGYSQVFALSNTNFYFITSNKLTYTLDNGASWLTYTFPDSQPLSNLFFYSKSIGFILQNGILYKSTDQGSSWTKVFPDSTFTEKIVSHTWLTDKTGYAIGAKAIYETLDSGQSWTLKNPDIDSFTYQARATPPLLCEF